MKIFNFMFHTVKFFTSAWEQKTQNVMEKRVQHQPGVSTIQWCFLSDMTSYKTTEKICPSVNNRFVWELVFHFLGQCKSQTYWFSQAPFQESVHIITSLSGQQIRALIPVSSWGFHDSGDD